MNLKKYYKFINLTFTLAIIIFFYLYIDWSCVLNDLININKIILAIYCIFVFPAILLLASLRQFLTLKYFEIDISFSKILKASYLGMLVNNFVPAGFGNDITKYYLLKTENPNFTSAIFADKIIGLISSLGLATISTVYFYLYTQKRIFILLGLIFVIGFVVYKFFYLLKNVQFVCNNKFCVKIFHILLSVTTLQKHEKFILIIISVFIFLLGYFGFYLFALAYEFDIFYMQIFYSLSLISITDILPFSINGLGIRESFTYILMSYFSINFNDLMVMFLVSRTTNILLSFPSIVFIKKG